MKPLCIYHANCVDGFAAAWVVRKFFDDHVDFFPGIYQNPPPNVRDRLTFLVDFSYRKADIDLLVTEAAGLVVLDHHKSAKEELSELLPTIQPATYDALFAHPTKAGCVFDLNHSGAMITWRFFFPTDQPPRLLAHIEDRDLWKFQLPGTKEIHAWLTSHPCSFNTWDDLMAFDLDRAYHEGVVILRKQQQDLDRLLPALTRTLQIRGQRVQAINLPPSYASEAGHLLAEGWPFAVTYWDSPDGRHFSLRSRPEGVDVSVVAQQYGGGGHANAAGFRVSIEEAQAFEVTHHGH